MGGRGDQPVGPSLLQIARKSRDEIEGLGGESGQKDGLQQTAKAFGIGTQRHDAAEGARPAAKRPHLQIARRSVERPAASDQKIDLETPRRELVRGVAHHALDAAAREVARQGRDCASSDCQD